MTTTLSWSVSLTTNRSTSRAFHLRRWISAVVLVIALLLSGRRAAQLAADPVGEKECPPLDPEAAEGEAPAISVGSTLPWAQQGGTINDASCLNRTHVHGIVQVTSEEDIQAAVVYAKENNLKVALAGVRHSMGGQAFFRQAVVLDMTHFNRMTLNAEERVLSVQSGATWHDIQAFLHPRFAVKAMQSTDIFTVGGSISVNAHGMDHQVGALGSTIRSLRVLLTDGTIVTASRQQNQELFDLVIGGYGLFGIILDAELEITDNVIYQSERRITDYRSYPELFARELAPNPDIGLMYAHLSTAPQNFLEEMIVYTYERVEAGDVEIAPLGEVSSTKLRRFVLNFSKLGPWPMRLKWFAEKRIEPYLESCSIVPRTQAMGEGEACLVSRNEPMHDSVRYLQNNLKYDTDILHEYFIPRAAFIDYVDGMRELLLDNDANLLNASVRVVHEERNFLTYAPEEMFSLVLYINQPTTPEGNRHMEKLTRELIDLTIVHGGAFFLPYQLHYTRTQLEAAYPQIDAFFAAKERYDPAHLLTNTFYERYR